MSYLLGIDVGTGSTKAVVVDPQRRGEVLGLGSQEYPLHTPKPLWAEQDPEDWWRVTVEAVKQAIKLSGVAGTDICGVGLSGQMQGPVFLDRFNNPVRPAILWCDQRAGEEAAEITAKVGESRIIDLTRCPVLAASVASKIVWLRKHEPGSFAKVRRVVLAKDYLRLKLTAEYAANVTDASATALFSVQDCSWAGEMLDAIEIPKDWLPKAYESATVSGRVTSRAAELIGLSAGIPVVAGGGDDAKSALGCGAVETGIIASSIGTSGILMAVSNRSVADHKRRVDMFCHAIPQKWQFIGVTYSAGASLRWFKDAFCDSERAAANNRGVNVYDLLCSEANSIARGSEGPIFLPHLTDMRTPTADPHASGVFFGITIRHTKPHFLRAVLEGVAFGLRDSVGIFKELGVPVKQIRAIGGGARNDVWRQIQADVLGLEHVTVSVTECAAFGAALLAGVGAGVYRDAAEACQSAITLEHTLKPNPENLQLYDRSYAKYRQLCQVVYQTSNN